MDNNNNNNYGCLWQIVEGMVIAFITIVLYRWLIQ